jgi:hypothetical protein
VLRRHLDEHPRDALDNRTSGRNVLNPDEMALGSARKHSENPLDKRGDFTAM